jgi:hypothetical protein
VATLVVWAKVTAEVQRCVAASHPWTTTGTTVKDFGLQWVIHGISMHTIARSKRSYTYSRAGARTVYVVHGTIIRSVHVQYLVQMSVD